MRNLSKHAPTAHPSRTLCKNSIVTSHLRLKIVPDTLRPQKLHHGDTEHTEKNDEVRRCRKSLRDLRVSVVNLFCLGTPAVHSCESLNV